MNNALAAVARHKIVQPEAFFTGILYNKILQDMKGVQFIKFPQRRPMPARDVIIVINVQRA